MKLLCLCHSLYRTKVFNWITSTQKLWLTINWESRYLNFLTEIKSFMILANWWDLNWFTELVKMDSILKFFIANVIAKDHHLQLWKQLINNKNFCKLLVYTRISLCYVLNHQNIYWILIKIPSHFFQMIISNLLWRIT